MYISYSNISTFVLHVQKYLNTLFHIIVQFTNNKYVRKTKIIKKTFHYSKYIKNKNTSQFCRTLLFIYLFFLF